MCASWDWCLQRWVRRRLGVKSRRSTGMFETSCFDWSEMTWRSLVGNACGEFHRGSRENLQGTSRYIHRIRMLKFLILPSPGRDSQVTLLSPTSRSHYPLSLRIGCLLWGRRPENAVFKLPSVPHLTITTTVPTWTRYLKRLTAKPQLAGTNFKSLTDKSAYSGNSSTRSLTNIEKPWQPLLHGRFRSCPSPALGTQCLGPQPAGKKLLTCINTDGW